MASMKILVEVQFLEIFWVTKLINRPTCYTLLAGLIFINPVMEDILKKCQKMRNIKIRYYFHMFLINDNVGALVSCCLPEHKTRVRYLMLK